MQTVKIIRNGDPEGVVPTVKIIRNGDPEKAYAFFICGYCGCEFKVLRSACNDIHHAGWYRCPECGDFVPGGMTYNKYKEVRAK